MKKYYSPWNIPMSEWKFPDLNIVTIVSKADLDAVRKANRELVEVFKELGKQNEKI